MNGTAKWKARQGNASHACQAFEQALAVAPAEKATKICAEMEEVNCPHEP